LLQANLDVSRHRDAWFASAVLSASLPVESDVVEISRRARLDGTVIALSSHLGASGASRFLPVLSPRDVEIVVDAVLVDVGHTSTVEFATGIQRVVKEAVRGWHDSHDIQLVGWTSTRSALRRLDAAEQARVLGGTPSGDSLATHRRRRDVIVPRGGAYLLPELNLERESLQRVAALARFSGLRTGAIGYDTVPISSSETSAFGVSGRFASYLSAVKFFGRVVAISVAAGVEYSGWRRMLVGSGVAGPEVEVVVLPAGVPGPGVAPVVASPLVLCVGSHEPRKNHGAVLQAAELLWREGLEFSLLFVGGNSWGSDEFVARVERLSAAGRDVRVLHAVDDAVLWGLYRAARFTVFPSLNEGFGLPVVESLSVGTPVVTSSFGSMREIVVAGGGGVLVDPRDDHDVARGMRELLVNDELRERLSVEALARPVRTWADYAADTWTTLTTP
jgi:glycosyltransferase involved in cell wall biosynthesis